MAKTRDAADRAVIHAALKLWIKNARAAIGTEIGLGRTKAADELRNHADDIENRLLAEYDEQGALALAGAGAGN